MPNPHHTFPRLQTSPNTHVSYSSNPRTPESHSFALDGGYSSLPHTPRAHRDPHTPGQRRSIWTTMRRDRQSRIHSIIEARSAKAGLTPNPGTQDSAGFLSVKDLPKAIRLRARDSAWLLGHRSKTKTVRLSQLADAMRTTVYDEDDVILDSLLAAERSGTSLDPIEQSADFDAIQEIVSLRRTARILLRLQLEHPDAATRQAVNEIMAKVNSSKKKLKLPVPQPLTKGPSFYFSADKFELDKQLHLFDELGGVDGDSLSSSSEELSDCEDEGGGAYPSAFGGDRSSAQRVDSSSASAAAAAFAASASCRRRRKGATVDQEAHANHLVWVRKYAEYSNMNWEYGAPHLFQLLNPLPQCGFAMARTFESAFRVQRSSIKEPEAFYLLAAAAAQVKSYPLICLAEERVMSSCYDDGDVYETWLSQGISASSAKLQLLARFGTLLSERPWAITAQDIKSYVDEYVRIHSEVLVHQAGRQHGDSSTLLAHRTVHRSLSTSVVSGAPTVTVSKATAPVVLSEFSRKSLEENAVRDLLHSIMITAVGHGLGSFGSACGIAPDLDQPSGSFFGQMDLLAPVEIVAGLSYTQPPPSPVFPSHRENGECLHHTQQQQKQQQEQLQRRHPWAPPMHIDQVERNTTDLITRLQFGTPPESSVSPRSSAQQIYSGYPALLSQNHRQHRQFVPPPPASMLRHISGVDMHYGLLPRGAVGLSDPMESSAPQFAAYRHMKLRKLARYELPDKEQQQQHQQQQQQSQPSGLESQPFLKVQQSGGDTVPCTNTCVSPTSPLQMVHNTPHKVGGGHQKLHNSGDLRMSIGPRSVHLSQREDLRWDVLSSYLQQQLSINEDHLGNEVQAARGITGRPFVEAAAPPSQDENHNVFLADTGNAPLKSEVTKPEWEQSLDAIGGGNTGGFKNKSYSLTNILSLGNANNNTNSSSNNNDRLMCLGFGSSDASLRGRASVLSLTTRCIDVRRFHDAIWHFTMSLYHIYEEYYFYNKYKNETTPDNSQGDALAGGSISVPIQSPDASTTDMGSMDVDYEGDLANLGGYLSAGEKPQDFNIWLTEELKSHIRAVVRSPETISAASAQPPVATGLSICAEEMVLINLIISLAKRQAEIIHGIRAIREYEHFY